MSKIEIKKVVIALPKGDIEITLEQARELKIALDEILDTTTYYTPAPQPVYPTWPWRPSEPWVTYTSSTAEIALNT